MDINMGAGSLVTLLELLVWILRVLFVVLVFYIGYIAVALTLFLQNRSWENALRVLVSISLHIIHLLMFLNPAGVYNLFNGSRLWVFLFAVVILCTTYGGQLILRIFSQREQDRRLAIYFLNYFLQMDSADSAEPVTEAL